MKMRRWKVEPGLSFSVKAIDGMDSELYGTSHCSELLSNLLADGDFFLQGNDEGLEIKQSILKDMANKGFAEQRENTGWSLTSEGRNMVSVSYVLKQRQKVVRIRNDLSIDKMEIVELLLQLQMNGWKGEAVESKESERQIAKKFYNHGEEKIWYQSQSKDAVCREYLILLLSAGTHLQPVPHLQPTSVYLKMLGKETTSRKRRGSMIFLPDEDIWFDESIVQRPSRTAASKKRPRRNQVLQALQDADQGPMAVPESAMVEQKADGEASDGGSSSSSVSASENLQKSNSPSRSPSAGSRSSASSTSGSGSGSSSSSSPESSGQKSDDNMPDSARATGIRRERNSEFWGPYRFTPTKTGWQVTCPYHETDGKTHCTKTRSSNVMGKEMATRMLKAWALWGKTACSKEDHQKRVWREVCDAQKNNTLPSSDTLDKQV